MLLDIDKAVPQYADRTRHRFFIDNRDVTNVASSPFKFTVYLADPFKDTSIGTVPLKRVETVELKALAFPKIANEAYVIMDVDELRDEHLVSTNDAANGSFVMYFDSATMTTGTTKPMKGLDFWQRDVVFKPVIPTLSTLHVTFKKADGNVVSVADTANANVCSFMLEITTQDVGAAGAKTFSN